MAIYEQHNKMVAFADDITAARTLEVFTQWWDHILDVGPSYGYFPQPNKSWLIVKDERLAEAHEIKKDYINEKIEKWSREINLLAEIATTYPQVAY